MVNEETERLFAGKPVGRNWQGAEKFLGADIIPEGEQLEFGSSGDTMNTARATPSIFPDLEEPIRAELFSVERLEQHAESLAAAQIVTSKPEQGRPLIPRVLENGRVLLESYRAIAWAIQKEHAKNLADLTSGPPAGYKRPRIHHRPPPFRLFGITHCVFGLLVQLERP
jgi:hypothetical protein